MATTTVTVENASGVGLFLAVSRVEDNCRSTCPSDPWAVLGWFRLENGQRGTVANPTGNQFWYYYAERDDGLVYSGPFPDPVNPVDAFFVCRCAGVPMPPFITAGFVELDLNAFPGGVKFT